MNLAQEIYNTLEKHCGGDIRNVRGATEQSLKNMKDGKHSPKLSTISKIFKANNVPAELVITVEIEGKKGKTKFKL